jgi:hypothetical protein
MIIGRSLYCEADSPFTGTIHLTVLKYKKWQRHELALVETDAYISRTRNSEPESNTKPDYAHEIEEREKQKRADNNGYSEKNKSEEETEQMKMLTICSPAFHRSLTNPSCLIFIHFLLIYSVEFTQPTHVGRVVGTCSG